MLFNSVDFLLFLIVVTVAYYAAPALCRGFFARANVVQMCVLLVAAVYFYAHWKLADVPVMAAALTVTYCGAWLLQRVARRAGKGRGAARTVFWTTLLLATTPLLYFKYAHFATANLAFVLGEGVVVPEKALPLGISFFTFTLIAFLSDVYLKKLEDADVLEYSATVTLFPHLIAGPILLHHDMLPQFRDAGRTRFRPERIVVGMSIFLVGMLKKVFVADSLAPYASLLFKAAGAGLAPGALDCWRGAYCYTMQLYFDFSGYSDMAIGIAAMLGLMIPANFFSPYRSRNMIEFWRRWHISLSLFFREYLYIPLGGSRRGTSRKYANILIVMGLCGLWHGAGWNFIVWGLYHGLLIVANHIWRATGIAMRPLVPGKALRGALSVALTFSAVLVGWVIFRADDMASALVVLKGMAGLNAGGAKLRFVGSGVFLIAASLIAFLFPNVHQLFGSSPHALGIPNTEDARPLPERFTFSPTPLSCAAFSVAALVLIYYLSTGQGEQVFLYCQF